MTEPFKDHFSGHADVYARYRPGYPAALFEYLASIAPGHDLAWDCATGNGQAALGMAAHFRLVVATDASREQLDRATPHPRIRYRVAPAEQAPLEDASADLVTVAQALHWFDFDRFFGEVRRVLKPGAPLAAWNYGLLTVSPSVDAVIDHFYREVVGPYWPPERRYFDEDFASLPFPFPQITPPPMHLEERWDLDHLIGFLQTWSATQRYGQQHGRDPVKEIHDRLQAAWGPAETIRTIRWPLHLRVGRA